MGYELKIIIASKYANGYCRNWAQIDLSNPHISWKETLHYGIPGGKGAFQELPPVYTFGLDGDTEIREDAYGETLRFIPAKQAEEILHWMTRGAAEKELYRTQALLNLARTALQTYEANIGNCGIIFFGY